MVKILEQPENRRPAMMDGWYERQSLGSSAGVCNGAGEPGTAPPKRVLGGRESSSASALARTAAPVGSRMDRKLDSCLPAAISEEELSLRNPPIPRWSAVAKLCSPQRTFISNRFENRACPTLI